MRRNQGGALRSDQIHHGWECELIRLDPQPIGSLAQSVRPVFREFDGEFHECSGVPVGSGRLGSLDAFDR